jgi:hypothetical protein
MRLLRNACRSGPVILMFPATDARDRTLQRSGIDTAINEAGGPGNRGQWQLGLQYTATACTSPVLPAVPRLVTHAKAIACSPTVSSRLAATARPAFRCPIPSGTPWLLDC